AYVASQGNHTITDAFGLYVWGGAENVSSVITNWYGVFLSTPDITGTITNKYGLYADNYGTSGYPIYTNQGIVSIGGFLQLRDATQYPVDSVLYVGASGTIEGSGAAATGDLLYNIDGSAWTSLPIGTANYVLKSVGGVPTWSVNNAADADTLDGQHGTYYLALSNATGTLAATKLQLLAEGTVFIGGASANETRALTAADISAGTFSGAFGFDTEVAMDIAANDTSFTTNTSSKWGGVNMSTGGTIPTDKPANYQYLANFGFKSRGFQISAAYGNDNDGFRIRRGSDNASSENGANVWQAWKQLALLEETQTFTGNKTFSGTSIFNNTVTINVNTYIYGTGSDRYVWMSLGNGVTNRYGGYGFQNNGSNRWLIRMMGDGTDDLQIYSYGVGGTATLWDYATGDLTHAHQLYLTDSVNYVVDGVLYVSSGGLVASSGAAATGDLLYNIDGTAWTSLAIGTEGYVLKSVSGIPTWSVNNASDADTLDGQHGAYYLAFSNATGTVSATQLQLLAEGTVFIGGASANTARALTAADISAGTFPGAAYTFTTNLTVGGKLTVDNDIFLSNGSNGAIKYDGTLVEFVASSDDTAVPGGWARGVEWNAGGAATNAAQVGTLGSGDSISYLYFSVGATSGTSDYNDTDDA
ncbi:MAG: hypothetical protein GWN18_12165, partial [Thermoplasmata archaeon]|nr:hypothetical protein [Thermoplasmata archaeon]NIS20714.1 hypothetical protein [Thermoplasmata archaeon]NIT78118.1 hypothetical protein [Thermoplasmata archaeon]NIU49789.1 hypothetical protein [Thermoplasmata archaeon]NIV79479.1 hypothetical protein [Thermoplasmata archaeon]